MPTLVTVKWAIDTKTPVGVVWCAVSSPMQAKVDKISLPYQQQLGLNWMDAQGCDVAVVLTVPGFSRSDADIVEALDEFRLRGVTAYDDLKALWGHRLIATMWAYTHDRLGRSNTQHAYVTENVVTNGGVIYLHNGGVIDAQSLRGQIAIGGFSSASYIDGMKQRRASAAPKILASGLPMGRAYWTHKVVYDDKGKRVRVDLNDAVRPTIDAAITLLLEGLPWHDIPTAMKDRYGITHEDGRLFNVSKLHQMFYNPAFWGHTGHNYLNEHVTGKRYGRWAFDESIALPDGVQIYRDTIPPVITGDLAERVKDELRRRGGLKGKGGTKNAHTFNGLIVCGICGRNMIHVQNTGYNRVSYYACRLRPQDVPLGIPKCSNRPYTPMMYLETVVQSYMEQCLTEDVFAPSPFDDISLSAYDTALEETEAAISRLIARQANAENEDVADLYQAQINLLIARRRGIRQQMEEGETERTRQRAITAQRTAIRQELQTIDFEEFWTRPQPQINQFLLRLFAGHQLISLGGKIVGMKAAPRV